MNTFLCHVCGTEVAKNNKVVFKGKRVNCPKCKSNMTKIKSVKKKEYKCEKCGHNFS